MNTIFNHIAQLDKTQRNISMMVIDGPCTGEKALWSGCGYIYTSRSLPLWHHVIDDLASMTGGTIKTYDGNTVFFELLSSQPNLIICGCGHVSMAIIKLGRMLGFQVTALDDRPMFCDNARRAQADVVLCDNFEHGLSQVPNDCNNYFVIVTRGHRYDMACLKALIHRPHAYIGMMGSRFRIRQLKETLVNEGYDLAMLDEVHMPIGLSIKAETPEEIAVSIMAEIIQIKNEAYASYAYDKTLLKALCGNESTDSASSAAKERMALAVIIRRRGSAPRSVGTKMAITEGGRCIGTIGGGCAEAAVIQRALRCIQDGHNELYRVDMTGREAEDEGMVCGGVIDVWIEALHE